MAVEYPHVRVKIGFGADADPNVVEPPPQDLIRLQSRPPFGNTLTTSHSLYLTFESATLADVPGGSLTFTAWERDGSTKKWVKINETPATLKGRTKLNGTGVQDADLYIQVLTVTAPGGASQLTVHAVEQGTETDQGYGADLVLGTVTANQGAPNAGGADAWPVDVSDRAARILGHVVVDASALPTGAATEGTLATRASEATLLSILAQLDVALSTRASQTTVASILSLLAAALDTTLSSRATEATLATRAAAATQTDGTQKSIVRGGVKGATAAADVTSTAEGADHQAVDVQIYHGGAAIDPRSTIPQTVGTGGNAWAAAAVGAGGASASIDTRYTPFVSVFGNANGPTTLTVQLSQDGATFYASSTQAVNGDFGFHLTVGARYVRLTSSIARTITASICAKD